MNNINHVEPEEFYALFRDEADDVFDLFAGSCAPLSEKGTPLGKVDYSGGFFDCISATAYPDGLVVAALAHGSTDVYTTTLPLC